MSFAVRALRCGFALVVACWFCGTLLAQAEWQKYKSRYRGNFEVELPGQPEHSAKLVGEEMLLEVHNVTLARPTGAFWISYAELPLKESDERRIEMMESYIQGIAAELNGEFIKNEEFDYGDHHGRDVLIKGENQGQAMFAGGQTFLINEMLYTLMVSGTSSDVLQAPDTRRFLQSFRILDFRKHLRERDDSHVYYGALKSIGFVVLDSSEADQLMIGTCFVVDKQKRLAITAHHVVDGSKNPRVYFPQYRGRRVIREVSHYANNVRPVRANLLAVDPVRDLALLQLQSLPAEINAVSLARQAAFQDAPVFVVGNPANMLEENGTLWSYAPAKVDSNGFAVFKSKTPRGDIRVYEGRVMVSTKPDNVSQGNSGGPVFNRFGQLAGVAESILEDEKLLISMDASEVQEFLCRSVGEKLDKGYNENEPLLGSWKISRANADDPTQAFGVTFYDDHTMTYESFKLGQGHRQRGEWTYDDGFLTVDVPEIPIRDQVTWRDRHTFAIDENGQEYLFERR